MLRKRKSHHNTRPTYTNTPTHQANDPPAKAQQTTTSQTGSSGSEQANLGVGLYAVILIGGALAFVAYQYLSQSNQQKA